MSQKNYYKPRYTIAYTSKSKVWPYKDSYLRRFYAIRARRIKRSGLFIRCVLVAKTMKWTRARRFIRPFMQSAGTRNKSIQNKTAFGRVVNIKGKYRDRFYKKQQVRYFYGKIKENAFRNLFRNHRLSVSTRSHSFFSILESRLDIIFFRIRFLPTIFACHQYIHYQGLEVNGQLEFSPRANVRVGDMISVSPSSWKTFFHNLFMRVYYRRWGLYIRRSRLFTKLKKVLYFRRFKPKAKFKDNRSQFNIHFSKKVTSGLSLIKAQNMIDTLDDISKYKFDFNTKVKKDESFSTYNYNQPLIIDLRKSISKLNSFYSKQPVAKSINVWSETIDSNLYMYYEPIKWFKNIYLTFLEKRKNVDNPKDIAFTLDKLKQFQKMYLRLKWRKTFFAYKTRTTSKQRGYSKTTNMRKAFLRFYSKRYKSTIRSIKVTRLKGVHFYIPSYLQIDFRTLCAIKIQSPSYEDIYYPFRTSLAKRYSFYRSKGF